MRSAWSVEARLEEAILGNALREGIIGGYPTHEAVLVEVGNALCGTRRLRKLAAASIRRCYTEENMTIVTVDNPLFLRALEMYESREDKGWGLTDCVSFVGNGHGLGNAVTGDRHFVQAGFRALMVPPE